MSSLNFLTISILLFFQISSVNAQANNRSDSCFKVDTVFNFDHYEIKDNKILGIWPYHKLKNDTTHLNKLNSKLGFNYIFVVHHETEKVLNNFKIAGFNLSHMMIGIQDFEHAGHQNVIDRFKGAYAFYADEPNIITEWRGYKLSFNGMPEYIKQHSPGSLFITGTYRPTDEFDNFAEVVDQVMYTSYVRWYQLFPDIWVDYFGINSDQRWNWTYFKRNYKEKSQSNWIGTHQDQGEYERLFNHANDLGLNETWIYALQNDSWDEVVEVSEAAYKAGWLKKYERMILNKYKCLNQNPCDCKKGSNKNWELIESIKTNFIIEIE